VIIHIGGEYINTDQIARAYVHPGLVTIFFNGAQTGVAYMGHQAKCLAWYFENMNDFMASNPNRLVDLAGLLERVDESKVDGPPSRS